MQPHYVAFLPSLCNQTFPEMLIEWIFWKEYWFN